MKILLFGGTFDPPHNGHIHNLTAAIEAVRPDRAIVMPAGVPPHKTPSATPGDFVMGINMALLLVVNTVTKKLSGSGLW